MARIGLPVQDPSSSANAFTGSDGRIGELNRPFGECAFHSRIEPKSIITTRTKVGVEIARRVQSIPAQKDLRHGRIQQSEVTRAKQNVGSVLADEARYGALFVIKAHGYAGRSVAFQKSYIRRVLQFAC